jgi:hypothetical protein
MNERKAIRLVIKVITRYLGRETEEIRENLKKIDDSSE